MKKFTTLLFVICYYVMSVASQTINFYCPDGWEMRNVRLDLGTVLDSGSEDDTAIVPPYYHANYAGENKRGTAVVTKVTGYVNYGGGWMVKAKAAERQGFSIQSVPSNYIPNIYGENYGAFQSKTNLKKVILPPTIKEIGFKAFYGDNLTELVCMAVVPPKLNDEFTNVHIDKIIVPTGTLADYKATVGWNKFNIVEGAESYSKKQMVEHNGAWFEVDNGEAALAYTGGISDPVLPKTVHCLINGQWKDVPVTRINNWSVDNDIVISENVTEISANWRDGYNDKAIFGVVDNHPTFSSLTPNVITDKSCKTACYVFGTATIPHGITTIADNALNYCTTAYFPTTLTYIGSQSSNTSKYFTSEQPPKSSSRYNGYAPSEYLQNYNSVGYGAFSAHSIPAGYEYVYLDTYQVYWNSSNRNCILRQYNVTTKDIINGEITLPDQFYLTDVMSGIIDEYDLSFSGNSDIVETKIRIPEGIKKISSLNYNKSSKITTIYLPSTLDSCSKDIVAKYPELTDLYCYAEKVPNIVSNAFNGQPVYFITLHVQKDAIEDYKSTEPWSKFGNIVAMPGLLIESIYYTFNSNSKEAEVVQGDLKYKGEITIPAYVTNNGINYNVTSIEEKAFEGCSDLTSVTIPNSVTSIGNSVFSGCSELTSIVVESGNTVYDSRNNCNAIIETSSNTLIAGCKNTTIPNSVTSIGSRAFYDCSGLISITIPNNVTTIGDAAFSGCSGLNKIILNSNTIASKAYSYDSSLKDVFGRQVKEYILGEDVTSIGYYAFRGCQGMTSVTIGNNVTSIGSRAFYGCFGLTSVTIPNSVTSIGERAFCECSGLTSVKIPNNVTEIGDVAFDDCSGLTSVTIPSSVTSIGNSVFSGCSELTSIVVESGNTVYDSRNNCNAIIKTSSNTLIAGCKNTIIPNSVTEIGGSAFLGCSGLTSMIIPNSVKKIEIGAFRDCSSLTSVTIPNRVREIGAAVFSGCSELTSIVVESGNTVYDSRNNCNAIIETSSNTLIAGCKNTIIPTNVTSIDCYAFYDCKGIISVVIPNSVTKIRYCAFSGCSDLISVTIPNSVTKIEFYAFNGCSSLTSVTIPNNVTKIEVGAFYGCSSLTSVTIPNSVTEIGDEAFGYCGLTDVYCYANNIPGTSYSYDYDSPFYKVKVSDATLHVPYASIDTYKATKPWNSFGNIVALCIRGDVNGDGEVNVGDLVSVSNFMAGDESVSMDTADINEDGEVNVGDMVVISNIMSGNE